MFIVGVVLLLAVAVFVLENRTPVTLQFLGWQYDTQLGLALVAAAVVGAVVIYLAGALRHRELVARLRGTEARLREIERQRPAPAPSARQPAGDESASDPRG